MFISATTIGKDIVGRLTLRSQVELGNESLINRWTKIGLLISSVFAVVLALAVPSVVSLWYTIGTCIIPGLIVPVLASYFERLRIPAAYAFTAMLLGWLTSTASLFYGVFNVVNGERVYLFGIEPMYPGLLIAVVVWGVGRVSK
jgi:hypothetical protein